MISSFTQKEIAEIENERKELFTQTLIIKQTQANLEEKLNFLHSSQIQLHSLEELYWNAYGQLSSEREQFNQEQVSLNLSSTYATEFLKKIQQTYILNDVFHIWSNGHFATINGLKLGRLPSQPVDWIDINAAWGMIAMLLTQLSQIMKYQFKNYEILPLGNQSKVVSISEDKAQYELYGDHLFHIFWAHRYDKAMQGILDCVNQLMKHIKDQDPTFIFPYIVTKEHLKLQFNTDDKWTKAIKYMLINLKFIIAWVSRKLTIK